MPHIVVDGAENLGWTVLHDASVPGADRYARANEVVAHIREVGEGPSMDHKFVLPLIAHLESSQQSGGTTSYVWNRAFVVPLAVFSGVIQPAFGEERERLERLVRSVLPRGQVEDAAATGGERLVVRGTLHQPATKMLGIFTVRDAVSSVVWAMRMGEFDVVVGVDEIDPTIAERVFADAERAVAALRLVD